MTKNFVSDSSIQSVYNLYIKVLGFVVCAFIVTVFGAIIGTSLSSEAEDQTSDDNHVLNISMLANFKVHFKQKHYEIIAKNIDDDIKNIMTRKPISEVVVTDSYQDSEENDNDTAQIFDSSGDSKLL